MAGFQDVHLPLRSISMPPRLQPDSLKVVSDLKKLKSFDFPCTAEAIREKMTILADIFVRVQDMLSSPLTEKVIAKPGNGELIEGALDGSIAVIDACEQAKDLLLMLREQVREVQSSIRRSRGGTDSSSLERQIKRFICFRKKAKREAAKHARVLKKASEGSGGCPSMAEPESSQLDIVTFKVLKDVNDISGSVIKALFDSLSATRVSPKSTGRWSIVSRLMLTSHPQERLGSLTEVESVDSALFSILQSKNDAAGVDLKKTQKKLETLEGCILGFEEGMQSLFKCLIQYRVSLLNVLTS
ncbi:hypothetical protein SAY87_017041 [Trapa incisa]|uniref:Uncharacterized protein n=1 Tax=Trapa incisa TaxID=236973 RepID=A0AAN7QYJ7_9MYRT|nr:hypothetical protein SAY87_017041 [Trapa incisa]